MSGRPTYVSWHLKVIGLKCRERRRCPSSTCRHLLPVKDGEKTACRNAGAESYTFRLARRCSFIHKAWVGYLDRGDLGMALSVDEIAGNPALHSHIRQQSNSLVMAYEASPRVSSVFATQQRWLMAHAGLMLYFRRDPQDGRKGLTTTRFLDVVREHQIASRNTADAFIKELLKYGMLSYMPGVGDKRIRPMAPTSASLDALMGWAIVHLTTLDGLDGGRRLQTFAAGSDSLARLQPLIADGLFSSQPVREPEKTFSLFTWLNNGGVVMDWLISGIEPADADADRRPTGVASIAEFAGMLKLSRTHLARKLREAEALGSIGWEGARGRSVMWVSKGFRQEYTMAQAVKLAIIDAAFDGCFPGRAG